MYNIHKVTIHYSDPRGDNYEFDIVVKLPHFRFSSAEFLSIVQQGIMANLSPHIVIKNHNEITEP